MSNLNRRDFVRGLGIAGLALSPLVGASRAFSNTGVQPRLAVFLVAHGLGGPGMAVGSENHFDIASRYSPLNRVKEHVTLIDGVRGVWYDQHFASYGMALTGSGVPYSGGSTKTPKPTGASIESVLDKHTNTGTMQPLRTYMSASYGPGGSGASRHSYCWDTNLNPAPMYSAYQTNDLFLNTIKGSVQPSQQNQLDKLRRTALMDLVNEDLKTIKTRITPAEHHKLEQQLSSMASIRQRLGLFPPIQGAGSCQQPPKLNKPSNNADLRLWQHWDARRKALFAYIQLAFSCNLTNYSVMAMGEPIEAHIKWTDSNGKPRAGKVDPKKDFHQGVAHYGNDVEVRLSYEGSIREYVNHIVEFAESLDKVTEANGKTMLENTIIVVSGDLGDGRHGCLRKPIIMIGGRGAPGLKTGRYIEIPNINVTSPIKMPNRSQISSGLISARTEADLWREVAYKMGHRTKMFGTFKEFNTGSIGLL